MKSKTSDCILTLTLYYTVCVCLKDMRKGHGRKVISSLCSKGIDNGTQYLFIVFTYF